MAWLAAPHWLAPESHWDPRQPREAPSLAPQGTAKLGMGLCQGSAHLSQLCPQGLGVWETKAGDTPKMKGGEVGPLARGLGRSWGVLRGRGSPSSPWSLHGQSQIRASAYPTSPVEKVCWGRGGLACLGDPSQVCPAQPEVLSSSSGLGAGITLPERASLGSRPITLLGPYGRDEMAKQHFQLIATSLGVPHPPCLPDR